MQAPSTADALNIINTARGQLCSSPWPGSPSNVGGAQRHPKVKGLKGGLYGNVRGRLTQRGRETPVKARKFIAFAGLIYVVDIEA